MKIWNARSAQILTAAMFAAVGHSAIANSAIVYYKPATSWTTVDIHYGINNVWMTPPGVAMDSACTGWKTKTVDLGTATTWQVTFNNGSGTWDNNGGKNYTLGTGVVTVSGGVIGSTLPCDAVAPSKPGAPVVGTVGAGNISISWAASTDNVGVAGYAIYRNGVKVGTTATTSYTDAALSSSTSYTYTVVAFDAAGNQSAPSDPIVVVTLPGNKATVYYKPASSWTTVDIHYGINNVWTTPPGVPMALACTGWYSRTVELGSASSFAVTFNNGSGTWDNNSSKNYTLGSGVVTVSGGVIGATNPCKVDVTAPSVPTGATSTASTATSISLSWTASTDDTAVTGYNVYRNGVKIGTSATTSYVDTGLTPSTVYSYTLSAYDAATNTSAQSTALSVSTQPGTVSSAVVYYYTATKGWTSTNIHYGINGTWTTPPGVAMGETACTNWVKKTVDLGTYTSMKADFNNGTTWDNNSGTDYTINAGLTTVKDGVVTSNAVTPCYIDTTPPTTPTNVTASAKGTIVTLAWTASTDDHVLDHYVVTRTGGTGTTSFTTKTAGYTDSSGKPQTAYSYTVVAVDGANNVSTASTAATVTTGDQSVIPAGTFSWNNATVYFAMTDRFVNGDTSNDRSYCRESDQSCKPFSNDLKQGQATFHGGDLKGLTQKVNAGYFSDLGVNAIWISAPYEQIHGWVTGDGQKHYAYHGYYALDYTQIDANFGTPADLQALVDAAHTKGIRIVLDIVINHPGYNTLYDMNQYGFGTLLSGWQAHAFKSDFAADYNADIAPVSDTTSSKSDWAKWWSGNWIRDGFAGYPGCGSSDTTLCTGMLPDFITESGAAQSLAPILVTKWTKEGRLATEQASLDAWFAKTGHPRTVNFYITKWLTDLVRTYGIDGFRCDTAKNVDLPTWKALKAEAVIARQDWLTANPTKAALLSGDTYFWMTGEVYGHGVGRSAYFDNGFDSIINFSFMGAAGNLSGIDSTYSSLNAVNTSTPSFNMLSYISSHDIGLFDRGNLTTGLTSLFLAPGGIEIFYGDETKRPLASNAAGDHRYRGDMNWNSIDAATLAHAQKLGQFRNKHVAVGAGVHTKLSSNPYTFQRQKDSDTVVVALGASGVVSVNVGSAWANGTILRDAYTGATTTVTGGTATLTAGTNGVILLEAAQ